MSERPANDDPAPVDGIHVAYVEMVAQRLFALPRPRTQAAVDAAMPEMTEITWEDLAAISKRWGELERSAGFTTPGMAGTMEIVR